jgi:hypothetical protein
MGVPAGKQTMKPQRQLQGKLRKIVGFHLDEKLDWLAELECGHQQHVRHNPPWTDRHWVTTFEGRRGHIGQELNCLACPPVEAVRRTRVRQLFEARPSSEHTETGVLLFYEWLQEHHPKLVPTEQGDAYQRLKMDLEGLYK